MQINYSNQKIIRNKKSIFLAGPTPRRKGVESWRKKACVILEKLGFEGVVYIPEYSNGEVRTDYNDQAMWEREAMKESTVILFWIPRSLPDMPAFTTNVEFGYWLHTEKVIYGRPDNAEKIKYLDWLYKIECNKNPVNTLKALLEKAIEMMGK